MSNEPVLPATQSPTRFSIYVPSPKTRFNLGKADAKSQFGFPGISGLTSEHLFLEIGKLAHLTAGSDVRFQGRGNWDQFAQSSMTLSSMGPITLGSKGKMIIAAAPGGGKSPNFLANYRGSAPSWIDFNFLLLHYTVDGLHSRLKEMFYGGGEAPGKSFLALFSRPTPDWMKLHHADAKTQEAWFRDLDAATGALPDGAPEKGMLAETAKLLWAIGLRTKPTAQPPADPNAIANGIGEDAPEAPDAINPILDEMKWNPKFISSHLAPGAKWKTSDYQALLPLDPYAPTEFYGTGWGELLNKAQAILTQVVVYIRRLTESMETLLMQLENNIVFDKVRSIVTGLKTMGDQITLNMNDWSNQLGKMFEASNYATAAQRFGGGFDTYIAMKPPSKDAQPAQLDGASEPFDLSLASDFVLRFRDVSGGAERTIDFSDLASPAEVVLTLLPNDPAAPTSFSGETASLDVNGTSATVALDAVTGDTAEARATGLAQALNGQAGCTATSAGATVTVRGKAKGSNARVAIQGSTVAAGLGVSGSGAAPTTAISASAVKAKLDALVAGTASITLSGSAPYQAFTVKSATTGAEAYLEFTGPLALTLFGSNPATSTGTDALDATTGFTQWTNYLVGASRIFTPLQQAAQPVLESMQQLGDIAAKFDSALKSIQKALFVGSSIPSVGILAGKGGLALASQGKITGAGHSIVLYAYGKATTPPDHEKQTFFEVLTSGVIFPMNKFLEDAMEVNATKRPSLSAKGSIAAFTNGRINLVGEDAVSLVSLKEEVRAVGQKVLLDGVGNVEINAHQASAVVRGQAIRIGDPVETKPKGATKPSQAGTKVIDAKASKALRFAALDGDTAADTGVRADLAQAGTFKVRAVAKGKVDVKALELSVDFKEKAATLGSPATHVRVDDAKGTATVTAKTSVVVGIGKKEMLAVKKDGVTVSGKVDIGGVLTIQGQPGATVADVARAAAAVNAELQQLKTKYAATKAQFVALTKSVATLETKVAKLEASGLDDNAGYDAAAASLATLKDKLVALETEGNELLAQMVAASADDA